MSQIGTAVPSSSRCSRRGISPFQFLTEIAWQKTRRAHRASHTQPLVRLSLRVSAEVLVCYVWHSSVAMRGLVVALDPAVRGACVRCPVGVDLRFTNEADVSCRCQRRLGHGLRYLYVLSAEASEAIAYAHV